MIIAQLWIRQAKAELEAEAKAAAEAKLKEQAAADEKQGTAQRWPESCPAFPNARRQGPEELHSGRSKGTR